MNGSKAHQSFLAEYVSNLNRTINQKDNPETLQQYFFFYSFQPWEFVLADLTLLRNTQNKY